MANILKVHEQNTIQELAAQGWARRRIARELKLDRKTVRRYLETASKSNSTLMESSLRGRKFTVMALMPGRGRSRRADTR